MLDLIAIYKSFGATQAVWDVSLSVAEGEVVALLGPSGCGKSTLLALIAGLEAPDQGDIRWNDESVLAVPVHERRFGLMFQDFALFPHLNVFDNVAFGLRMQALAGAEVEARVRALLERVNLPGYGRRDVTTLSGGERQRVALARAIAPHPRLLMLDEPLGALDRSLREELLHDLRRLLRDSGQTAIVVTHDQAEAMTLAGRVAVLRAGRIEQFDTPDALMARPANAFVAEFLGLGTLLPARVVAPDEIETPLGRLPLPDPQPVGAQGYLLVRHRAAVLSGADGLAATVHDLIRSGQSTRTVLDVRGHQLRLDLSEALAIGQRVTIRLRSELTHFLMDS